MATNSTEHLSYFIQIAKIHLNYLSGIRHWSNLVVASEGDCFWIKDWTKEQIDSIEVKAIPYKTIYYAKAPHLYKQHSLLPEMPIPSLLWTAIERALPIELPAYNFNYFGLQTKVEVGLVASSLEKAAVGMLTHRQQLEAYIEQAPSVRLARLQWVMFEQENVFLLGEPNLPIQGTMFWREAQCFLPIGFDLELPILRPLLPSILRIANDTFAIFTEDGTFFTFNQALLQPLSRSSFRKSYEGDDLKI